MTSREVQLAAAVELPQLPKVPTLLSLTGPLVDWRQFDAFFTFVVRRFGDNVQASLKDSLGEAFLDSRYELTSAIAPGKGGNPVPQMFLDGWKRLSPVMNKSLPAMPKHAASLYSVQAQGAGWPSFLVRGNGTMRLTNLNFILIVSVSTCKCDKCGGSS